VIHTQDQLELYAKDEGAHKVRRLIEKALNKDRGSDTPAGVDLIRRAVEPIENAIKAAIADANSGKVGRRIAALALLQSVPPDVAAYLALKASMNAAFVRHTVQHVAMVIGSNIEEELRLATFENVQPNLYNTIDRQLKERGATAPHAHRKFVFAANKANVKLPTFPRADKLRLGLKLVELIIEVTGFIEVINVRDNGRSYKMLAATKHLSEWFKDRNVLAELVRPMFMPTVVPPRDWEKPEGGGYFTQRVRLRSIVKGCTPEQRALLDKADLSVIYDGLNAIQRTGWRLNRRIYDLMAHAWEHNHQIALPSADDLPIPPKPVGFDKEDDKKVKGKAWRNVPEAERKAWMSAARRIHELNAETRGKRNNLAQIMSVAKELVDEPVIYFPHQLDFRSRAYAVPVALHPQGPDQARALLTFAEGKPINDPRAAGWLMITGANLYGYDKAAFADRIAWVEERDALILRTDADPLADLWWTEADKPWCFLAWCFEYAAFLREGFGYVSSLPCSVDGSCNGLQHFSAMLRDPVGGAAVNLVPSPTPADIYQRVADVVIEKLKSMATLQETAYTPEQFTEMTHAAGWHQFGIDRKLTKRPVMVLPYGGTFRSCLHYVREAVAKKIADGAVVPFGEELSKAEGFLAKLVWESIGDVVVAARTAMSWLQTVARVATKEGVALTWVTPAGFPAYQGYRDMRPRRVKTKLQGSIVKLTLNEDGDKLDKDRQALGISPNFVHSMDASAMMLTIQLALNNGVTQFAMIHDSYGTVAADMDMLAGCLRHAFVDMYTDHNVLEEFLNGLPEHVRTKCPPLPAMGTLRLEDVLQSEFFFA
jgi:DNA-directed RNA polymerase